MTSRPRFTRPGRAGAGFSLIEVIVAISLIGIAFSSLLAVQLRLTARQRSIAARAARNAIVYQEVNRVESMRYSALDTLLVSDTGYTRDFSYIRRYTIVSPDTMGQTATGSPIVCNTTTYQCKGVTVRVVPLSNPADSFALKIVRSRTQSYNPLFTP